MIKVRQEQEDRPEIKLVTARVSLTEDLSQGCPPQNPCRPNACAPTQSCAPLMCKPLKGATEVSVSV